MNRRIPFQLIKPKDFIIKRRANAGTYVRGKWVPATTTDITISALINERLKFSTIQMVPEALKTKRWIRIFTNDLIKQKEDSPAQDADDILFGGQLYRVWRVESWGNVSGFSGYQALAVKVDTEVLSLIP